MTTPTGMSVSLMELLGVDMGTFVQGVLVGAALAGDTRITIPVVTEDDEYPATHLTKGVLKEYLAKLQALPSVRDPKPSPEDAQ